MTQKQDLEVQWNQWELELTDYQPSSPERRKASNKIAEIWAELVETSQRLQQDPIAKDPGQRFFGLDPLKISALNMALAIETDEHSFLNLYLKLTHNLILSNIMRLRILPSGSRKMQAQFQAAELSSFPMAHLYFEEQERDLWKARIKMQNDIAELREEYELFVFAESSYEAARSFGAQKPDIQNHRVSWQAFSQLLTGVSLQIHDEQKNFLIKRSKRIQSQREALFEDCAQLLARKGEGMDVKKVRRQLRHNLSEIKRLEQEIEITMRELSVPGLGNQASLLVKKKPGEATTTQLNKLSQSTGDKT
ncbi:MAG: hypothetical protein H7318_02930 [Oligoflexus sp.]|nr:hypothetical protein [Oligoflexus sp.]